MKTKARERITRFLPIDFAELFRQARIEPCCCKLARPLVAGGEWCLMIDHAEDCHSEFIIVNPPPFLPGETSVRIAKDYWVFSA